MTVKISLLLVLLAGVCCFSTVSLADADTSPQSRLSTTTTENFEIPLDELDLLLKPMMAEELEVEAEAWFSLLRETVFELNQFKLKIKRQNQQIKQDANASGSGTDPTESAVAQAEKAEKDEELERIAELREIRTVLIDRLNHVLDALTRKTGLTDDQKEQDLVLAYRHYIKVNHGLEVDVTDTRSTWSTLVSWLKSKEGGKRWGRHISVFLLAVLGFWLLGELLSRLFRKALTLATHISEMMKQFIVKAIRTVMIFIGILIGLSALEVNVTPVLAVVGATGFIVAFALQDTLSNFASGLMILFYRPFDVGDWVDVSGVIGKVKSMTLVTTTIMTPDNKLMIVPNNSIWGNIITNVTGSSTRRVDLEFGIGYEADLDNAQDVLLKIMASHERVLKKPEPVVHVHELADSSVNLICRPWVKTDDYWTVYWDITREVKLRFDAEGISIPFPQRDVHIHEPAKNGS